MEFLFKSVLISTTLVLFYRLFLQRETFFQSIRGYFIIGIVVSLVLPLLIIPKYIEVEAVNIPELADSIQLTPTILEIQETIASTTVKKSINWVALLTSIYWIGMLILIIKFSIDLLSLLYLIYKSKKRKEGSYILAETQKEVSPFSFFNCIVYNKSHFNSIELKDIITHEKVHVYQKHSIDILFMQLFVILQWFNPFIWLYKKDAQQNLEYIADRSTQEKSKTSKKYQYLLLKTSISRNPFALSTNFYNSHLKKRIIMLQKSQTKRFHQLKYFLLVPLIALFLYSFNIKEIVITKKTNTPLPQSYKSEKENLKFINPISIDKTIIVLSGFGKRVNPFTKKMQMHQGIDIKAYKGVNVYATADGIIIKADYNELIGNYIQIQHADNYQTNYHHLGTLQVKVGEKVKVGDVIGTVGNTGKSTGPHLHYEIVKNAEHINPVPFLTIYSKKKKSHVKSNASSNFYSHATTNTIIISSKTTDKELEIYKATFKEQHGVDLNFYDIKRNKENEIVAIKIKGKSKNSSSSFSLSTNEPIDKITIGYEKKTDEITIETAGVLSRSTGHSNYSLHIDSDEGNEKPTKIKHLIKKGDSFYSIAKMYGVSPEDLHKLNQNIDTLTVGTYLNIHKSNHSSSSNSFVFINEDEDDNGNGLKKRSEVQIINNGKSGSFSYSFSENDDDDKNTVTTYIINGKKMSKEAFEKFDKSKIRSIEIKKEVKKEK